MGKMTQILDDEDNEILRFEIFNDSTGKPTMDLVLNQYLYIRHESVSRHVDPYQLLGSIKSALAKYEMPSVSLN
jgi:hypothetical protein